jgi:hypothetical protein
MLDADFWSWDLTKPLPGETRKREKKTDHRCPHDRKHPTGMELCEQCGDFGVCAECGVDYIKRDMGGGPICHRCVDLHRLETKLAEARAEQAKRKAASEKVA